MTATMTRRGPLDCQVCVPSDWSDDMVRAFAEREYPCGTEHGWSIRREGSPALRGRPERVACETLDDHVHVMLDS